MLSLCQLLDFFAHCIRHFLRLLRPSQIRRLDSTLRNILHRFHQNIRCIGLTQPPQHLRRRPKRCNRIRKSHSRDIKRTPMNRLEHRRILPRRIQIRRRRNPDTARQRRSQIRKNVSMQIRRNHRIDTLRLQHHPRSHRINQHFINLHIRELLPNVRCHLIPKHHPIPLRVAFRHNSQLFPRPAARRLKREPHDALHAVPGEDRDFCRDGPCFAGVRNTAVARVLAF